jgi:hypothetical protein
MKNACFFLFFSIFLIFLISTCGGGGGGGGGSTLHTGKFVDGGPVAGLKYSTATQSGETGVDGAFFYQAGESVSFHVGDILIGQAAGASSISPFDLAGIPPPQSSIEIRRAVNEMNRRKSSPLGVAANIAVFLQTLDNDGDPSNGIQIPAQMHTLAAGASINFHQQWNDFPRDFSFRKLLAQGRSAGLWGGTRPVRNPAYALDSLYAGLGLTPAIYAVAVTEHNSNGDGTADNRITYTYDANGNRTMEEDDYNADGTMDYRNSYTYDANGNLTMAEGDDYAGGTVVYYRTSTYIYDANGCLTVEELETNIPDLADHR